MKSCYGLMSLVLLATSQLARAEGVSCMKGYVSPGPGDWSLIIAPGLLSSRGYTTGRDPVSGSEYRDYRGAGLQLAAEIDKLGPSLDVIDDFDATFEARVTAARDFSKQLATVMLIMLKQAEGIVESEICQGRRGDNTGLAMAYTRYNLKFQSATQTLQLANKYFHGFNVGPMSGSVGRVLYSGATGDSLLAPIKNEAMLRIRQYYYALFKLGELGFAIENPKESVSKLQAYRNHPSIAPQIARLREAFLDSRKDFAAGTPFAQAIEATLQDL